jgi:acetolactate synthase I/III small subunit
MTHTLSVLVQNKFGVLSRVSGLFSGRGFNIDSLCVAETLDNTKSRMTIVVHGDESVLEQITKQLNKLIDIIKVTDFDAGECVERELVLIKINITPATRSEAMQIVDIFRARIVSVQTKTMIIELTGGKEKNNAFIELIKPFGIKEIARTGKIALSRNGK